MHVLFCRILEFNSQFTRFAFEVDSDWSITFMLRLATRYLDLHHSDLIANAFSFDFAEFSDYDPEDDDVVVDLIFYVEEVSNALLSDPRQ